MRVTSKLPSYNPSKESKMIFKKMTLPILLTRYIVTVWSEIDAIDMGETNTRVQDHFPNNIVDYWEDSYEPWGSLDKSWKTSSWGDVSIGSGEEI